VGDSKTNLSELIDYSWLKFHFVIYKIKGQSVEMYGRDEVDDDSEDLEVESENESTGVIRKHPILETRDRFCSRHQRKLGYVVESCLLLRHKCFAYLLPRLNDFLFDREDLDREKVDLEEGRAVVSPEHEKNSATNNIPVNDFEDALLNPKNSELTWLSEEDLNDKHIHFTSSSLSRMLHASRQRSRNLVWRRFVQCIEEYEVWYFFLCL
jgi:hypothetical protein